MSTSEHEILARLQLLENQVADLRQQMNSKSPVMTVRQCAAYIGRTPQAVYDLVYKQQIPYRKQGVKVLFETARIDKWLGCK